jgi:hypothetical protein
MCLSQQTGLVPNEKGREPFANFPAFIAAYPVVDHPKSRVQLVPAVRGSVRG